MLLKLFGQLGGRKWLAALITGVLAPVLAIYLPAAAVTSVLAAITALAASFIFAQGSVDKATGGGSSTATAVLKDMQKKK